MIFKKFCIKFETKTLQNANYMTSQLVKIQMKYPNFSPAKFTSELKQWENLTQIYLTSYTVILDVNENTYLSGQFIKFRVI